MAAEHLRFLKVGGVTDWGEPAIHLRQDLACRGALALALPQPTETQRGVQFH